MPKSNKTLWKICVVKIKLADMRVPILFHLQRVIQIFCIVKLNSNYNIYNLIWDIRYYKWPKFLKRCRISEYPVFQKKCLYFISNEIGILWEILVCQSEHFCWDTKTIKKIVLRVNCYQVPICTITHGRLFRPTNIANVELNQVNTIIKFVIL